MIDLPTLSIIILFSREPAATAAAAATMGQ